MNDFDFRFQWRGSENQQLQKKKEEKKIIKINPPIELVHWTVLLANNRMRIFRWALNSQWYIKNVCSDVA